MLHSLIKHFCFQNSSRARILQWLNPINARTIPQPKTNDVNRKIADNSKIPNFGMIREKLVGRTVWFEIDKRGDYIVELLEIRESK